MDNTFENKCEAFFLEYGKIEYNSAIKIQRKLLDARKTNIIDRDVYIMLEHHPVFTLGKRGNRSNILVDDEILSKNRISLIQTDRGGDVTYHGPGQLIVYYILDLRKAGLGIKDFVSKLEEVMIKTASLEGIYAYRNSLNRGVWAGNKKLGSIGLAVHHGITSHGIAFNVNLPLEKFLWINPCGLKDTYMTSVEQELGSKVDINKVRKHLIKSLEWVFNIRLKSIDLSDLNKRVLFSYPEKPVLNNNLRK